MAVVTSLTPLSPTLASYTCSKSVQRMKKAANGPKIIVLSFNSQNFAFLTVLKIPDLISKTSKFQN
jgi:hypothetical protein